MTSHSVIKFVDESVGRIALTESIRHGNMKKFSPVTCKDLPEENVKVKWQKSMSDGSFHSDGYFAAEVLAIAGSFKTALAKATELGIKLHSSPLLSLPESTSPKIKKRRVRETKEQSERVRETKEQSERVRETKEQSERVRETKEQSEIKLESHVKSRKRSSRSLSSADKAKDKKKKKKLKLDDVSIDRCSSQANLAIATNPLLSKFKIEDKPGNSSKNDAENRDSQNGSKLSSTDTKFNQTAVDGCTSQLNFEVEATSSLSDTVADHSRGSPRNREHSDSDNGSMSPGFDFKLPPDNETGSMSPGLDFELTTHKKTGSLDFDFEWDSPKKTGPTSPDIELPTDKKTGPTSPDIELTPDKETISNSPGFNMELTTPKDEVPPSPAKSNKSDSSVATIPVLNNEIEPMDTEKSSSDSDSESVSSTIEDEVSKLAAEKDSLTSELRLLKKELTEWKRKFTLSNNLRIAHNETIAKLTKELKTKYELIETLQKRNSALQDTLWHNLSGPVKCKEENAESKAFSNNKDTKLSKKSESMSLIEPSTPKKGPSTPKKGPSTPKKGPSTPKKGPGTPKKEHRTPKKEHRTPKKERSYKNSPGNMFFESDEPQVVKVTSPASNKKNKKSKERAEEITIAEVCDKVLQHLKGESPLVPDKKGYIDLGNSVRVDKQCMEKTLRDHKGDVQKIAKGLTKLAWTASEREERSLEGGKNNRFPNAPAKKAATPVKVNSCLGVVKAHLLHLGEKEGMGLTQTLKLSRKAIGAKFSQDSAQAKKTKDQE